MGSLPLCVVRNFEWYQNSLSRLKNSIFDNHGRILYNFQRNLALITDWRSIDVWLFDSAMICNYFLANQLLLNVIRTDNFVEHVKPFVSKFYSFFILVFFKFNDNESKFGQSFSTFHFFTEVHSSLKWKERPTVRHKTEFQQRNCNGRSSLRFSWSKYK